MGYYEYGTEKNNPPTTAWKDGKLKDVSFTVAGANLVADAEHDAAAKARQNHNATNQCPTYNGTPPGTVRLSGCKSSKSETKDTRCVSVHHLQLVMQPSHQLF